MSDRIQLRRDTAANWSSVNPVLAQAEVGVVTDEHYHKVGDGVTPWNDLPEQFPDHIREGDSRLSDARTPTAHTHTLADVTDAGTAASRDVTTSATDTTAGRVMKVGDWGVGSAVSLSSFAEADRSMFFQIGAANAPTDAPVLTSINWTGIVARGFNNNNGVRLAFGQSSPELPFYIQRRSNAVDLEWIQVYHQRNILGTVSQSGGVPTGAIIERGSNANGEYVKFADGTLIARHYFSVGAPNTADGAVYTSASAATWPYPTDFAAPPAVTASDTALGRTWIAPVNPNTLAASLRPYKPLSSSTIVTVEATAIGRWY